MTDSPYHGIVPYLFYDDAAAAMDWYATHFGFVDSGRWPDADGGIANGEMQVGNTEIWLDGGGKREDPDERPTWIGVWVDDVDAVYQRITATGLTCDPPVTREFGIQMLTVADPFGYLWGFMRRVEG